MAMTNKKISNHGIIGWAVTALVVAVYDYWAISNSKQTMSNAFKKGLFRKSTSGPVLIGWLILSWHLLHPPRLKKTDLFSIVLDRKNNG